MKRIKVGLFFKWSNVLHHQPKHWSDVCLLPIVHCGLSLRPKQSRESVRSVCCEFWCVYRSRIRGSPSLSAVAVIYCTFSVDIHFLHECFLLQQFCWTFRPFSDYSYKTCSDSSCELLMAYFISCHLQDGWRSQAPHLWQLKSRV